MTHLVLLGPQRQTPNVRSALDMLGISKQVAMISAGWQEREGEVLELQEHLGRPVVDLMLYDRTERVFADDPPLARAYRARQDRLRAQQALYRIALQHAVRTVEEIGTDGPDPALLAAARRQAIRALRRVDRVHLAVAAQIRRAFGDELRPRDRPAVARQREQILAIVSASAALLLAGGHVAILLNRLRLFGMSEFLRRRPVVAWSAGAMALSEAVVLFHDRPVQGTADPEVLDAGLGLAPGIVALPDARRRLILDDPKRIALFGQRFAPRRCLTLDRGAALVARSGTWTSARQVDELGRDGRLRPFPPS